MVIVSGLIASLFVVILSFTIQRRNIVLVSSMLAAATIVQYALLGKYSTMVLAVVTIVYGVVTLFEKRYPVLQSRWSFVVLSVVYSVVFFAMNGFTVSVELLAFVASLSGVVVMALDNQLVVKWLMLVNGLTWMVYQLSVGAHGQLPGELFYTVGVLFSLFVLYRAKFKGIDLSTVPELSTVVRRKLFS